MNLIFSSIPFKKYIRAFFLAFIITVVLQAVLSIVFSFLPPNDKFFEFLCTAFPYFGAFLAAFFSGYGSEKNGGVTGIITSVIFIMILFFAGLLFFKSAFSFEVLLKEVSASALCGICGGIIGINCK